MIRNEIYAYQELEIRQDRRILDGSGRLVETFVLSWVLLSRRPISESAHKGWKLQARDAKSRRYPFVCAKYIQLTGFSEFATPI